MDGRVAQLDCTLRIDAGLTSTSGLVERLKAVAGDAVISMYADRMDDILQDDPHVYVLREVDCPVSLVVSPGTDDADLAASWGDGLARGVVKAIERADADCVAFESQADYVAAFAVDLLRGLAWERWYFGSFHAHRDRPVADTLRTLFRENHACLPAIMRSLDDRNALERVLEVIGPTGATDAWVQGFLPRALDDDEGRLFFASALRLIDDIALWTAARPGPEVLRSYLAARPPAVNWRDPRTLASAVFDAVRFLASHGHLRTAQGDSPLVREQLTRSLMTLDWLDTTWLKDRLVELLLPGGTEFGALPTRHPGVGSAPSQRALLDDLVAVVRERGERLDRGDPRSASNAIRLDAWLSERDSRWGSDLLVAPMIERVLRAWRSAAGASSPAAFIARMRNGDLTPALALLPEGDRQEATDAFDALGGLGQPAFNAVETLIGGRSSSSTIVPAPTDAPDRNMTSFASACAGVWLLARAVLDIRLPDVLAATPSPPPALSPTERTQAILLALALRWGGIAATTDGRIDPGLRLLAGWGHDAADGPATIAALRDRSAPRGGDHDDRQKALLHVLAGQRLVGGPVVDLHLVRLRDGAQALIAGDRLASVWPLGCVVDSPDEIIDAIESWSSIWEEATGRRPVLVGDGSFSRVAQRKGAPSITRPSASSDQAAAHRVSRERLDASLSALDENALGLPSDDLVVALMAISLLRVWARWLRQFGDSSVPYLLDQFIRRPGWISIRPDSMVVELASRPLDIVVQMSGYATEIEGVPWLGGRHIQYSMHS